MSSSIQAQLNEQWDQRFAELLAWRQKNGSCWVPKAEGPLGRWVARQRELRKTGKMLPERLSLLESIDFTWNTNEAAWAEKYALLTAWTLTHGHCCVPTADEEIGMWVAKQRQLKRQGRLSSSRIRQLESLGFVWSTSSVEWEEKFGMLLSWKKEHGHLRVPFNEGELGWWVNTQRQNRRKGKLSAEREKSLSSIGFVWEPGHYQRKRTGAPSSTNNEDCEFVDPLQPKSGTEEPLSKKPKYEPIASNIEELLSAAFGTCAHQKLALDPLDISSCSSAAEGGSSAEGSLADEAVSLPLLQDIPVLDMKVESGSPQLPKLLGAFTSPVSVLDSTSPADESSGQHTGCLGFLDRPTTPTAWPTPAEKCGTAPSGNVPPLFAQPF